MPSQADRPLNLVLLMADQQKATSLPLYGNPDTVTPALNALAARGVWARHCFTAHPFCLPSRCSLLTGRYAHATGVRGNQGRLPATETPLPALLQRAGYRTAASGHFHASSGGDRGLDAAFDMSKGRQAAAFRRHGEWVAAAPRRTAQMAGTLPVDAAEDVDAIITDDALAWLDGLDGDRPFFLEAAWIAPHPPYVVPPPYDRRYAPERLHLPPPDPPDAKKPAAQRRTAEDMGSWEAPEEERRRALAAYYGMVSLVDDQVARVLAYLERRGLRGNTIVVYTSDHGDYAGEHGMWGKSCTLYDALVRVSLVIAGPPGLVPAGRALGGLTQTIDLVPTLLDLLGLPRPDNLHGHSLRPLWEGGAPGSSRGSDRRGFDLAFAEVGAFPPAMVYDRQHGDNVPAGPPASGRQVEVSTMARTAEWKLVYSPGRDVQELYDLQADHGELRNRSGDMALAPIERALRDRILDWMQAYT